MKQHNFVTGKKGEEIARNYLLKNAYKILQSNFKTKFGEIDIIVSKNSKLIFVEVKLKIGEDFGTPEEMINKHKLSQVQATAVSFLQQNPNFDKLYDSYQLDAVCVVTDVNHEVIRINHYENITF